MKNYSEEGGSFFIYFAVFTTCLTAFATGTCFSWASPVLPRLQSADASVNPIGRPLAISESAWIVSTLALGLIFSPLVSSVCIKFFTKKTVLLIAVGPILVAHCICSFAFEVYLFILARFLMGVGNGMVWTVLGTYIAEIAEDRNRGLLGSIPGTMSNLGSLFAYIIGPYMEMVGFSIALIAPLILFYIGFIWFVPDSPYDLLMKKKPLQAEKSLQTLRRSQNVGKELAFMEETIRFEITDAAPSRLSDLLKDRGLRKGLIICVTLMTIQQLSGSLAVISYAEIIFQLAGSIIPSAISPMILGVVATLGSLTNLILVDRSGRKILLICSCFLESITLFSLGLYFYLSNSGIDSGISWMPIVSLILFMIAFNLALGVVPWVVTGEVFHSKVKPMASTITALSNFTWSFIVTMCFPYMLEYLGPAWTFWTFAICMVVGGVFCVTVLPETKGKNFQEIQKMLKK